MPEDGLCYRCSSQLCPRVHSFIFRNWFKACAERDITESLGWLNLIGYICLFIYLTDRLQPECFCLAR